MRKASIEKRDVDKAIISEHTFSKLEYIVISKKPSYFFRFTFTSALAIFFLLIHLCFKNLGFKQIINFVLLVSSLNVKRKKIHSPKKSLPIVKCKCGFEFLILFNVQTMGQAIRKHALEHKKMMV